MPFTVSHAAAVVPLRRLGLVWPALAAGSMAPDYEYLLRLDPTNRFGHGALGMFLFSLPAGMVVLWLFETFVRNPVLELLPPAVEERIAVRSFHWGGPLRFLNIVCSVQIGIFTHIVWDWFTHREIDSYPRALLLSGDRGVPSTVIRHFEMLQYISSTVGAIVLLVAFVRWFHRTAPCRPPSRLSVRQRSTVVAGICAVASMGAFLRAAAALGFPPYDRLREYFTILFAISGMAFFALAVLGFGVWKTVRGR